MNHEHQAQKLLEAERATGTAAVKYSGHVTRAARPCKMYGKYRERQTAKRTATSQLPASLQQRSLTTNLCTSNNVNGLKSKCACEQTVRLTVREVSSLHKNSVTLYEEKFHISCYQNFALSQKLNTDDQLAWQVNRINIQELCDLFLIIIMCSLNRKQLVITDHLICSSQSIAATLHSTLLLVTPFLS